MVRLGDLEHEHDLTISQKVAVLDLALKELGVALAMASREEQTLMTTYLLSSPVKLMADGIVLVPVEDGTPAL
jgi:hypothetical protein